MVGTFKLLHSICFMHIDYELRNGNTSIGLVASCRSPKKPTKNIQQTESFAGFRNH